jgi:hypothetical protein
MTMLGVAWKEPSRETEVSESLCLLTQTKNKVIIVDIPFQKS